MDDAALTVEAVENGEEIWQRFLAMPRLMQCQEQAGFASFAELECNLRCQQFELSMSEFEFQ
jgi:hypothetical protein